MSLEQRLSDASYRLYNRGRHKAAFEAATKPGTEPDFSGLDARKYAAWKGKEGGGGGGGGKPLGPGSEGVARVLPAGVESEPAEAALDLTTAVCGVPTKS